MTTITVDGTKTSTFSAIIWASNEFGSDSFSVTSPFPGQQWQFKFKDEIQATLFALKWAH